MTYIPDAYDQWKAHEAEQQAQLDKLPRCSECENPIQTEYCFEVNDELICPHCMMENHRKAVEDIVC